MNLPNRSSDAGPRTRPDCPTCGSTKWQTLAACEQCGDTCCGECPGSIETSKGIYCAKCIVDVVHNVPPEDWPELMPVSEIEAVIRYASVPEWLKHGNGWVN